MADARRAPLKDQTDITGARVLIVEARFYDDIQDALLEGALAELKAAGAGHDVITVPLKRTASPMTRRSRSAAWCAATPFISRSSRWSPRAD